MLWWTAKTASSSPSPMKMRPHGRRSTQGECACSAILAASHAHIKTLAMPLFGGKEHIATMEWAVHYIEDVLEPTGMLMPEVFFEATDATNG